jgi:hypothetical protein
MQEVVDMPGNTACGVTMANAIREDNTGNIVATREHGGKITTFGTTGRDSDDVAF